MAITPCLEPPHAVRVEDRLRNSPVKKRTGIFGIAAVVGDGGARLTPGMRFSVALAGCGRQTLECP